MARETVYKLIGLLDESHFLPSYHSGRENITAEKAFLLSLWYLSNQETFREISDRFNVTYSSVHRCLTRTLKFLLSKKKEIIRWPAIETTNIITNAFRSKQGMVNVIGAIDGSHVEINKPSHNQDSYINRKGYHSLLIQGIVDHSKRFIDVFCGEPGSMHDARLLRKSAIFKKISQNPDYIGQYFLLGDSA
ncbi:hypothetical protein RI129_003083 [Pyrocoelia pectoralis]|uniref:Putative nuclease HARBI1 n=1 Tax=Pyrocoelia pectoralis TaxID=417401 RepID=A0AAN7VN99_9COLE